MVLKKWIALFLIIIAFPVHAENLQVQLILNSIQGLHATERRGDELYFTVTEFRRSHVVKHYSIPEFPAVWSSQALQGIPKLKLWQKSLAPQERIELVITLLEHDSPPWDREDILGTVKLLLKNENGKLVAKWLEGNSSETFEKDKVQDSSVGRFLFKGERGLYQVNFQVITP